MRPRPCSVYMWESKCALLSAVKKRRHTSGTRSLTLSPSLSLPLSLSLSLTHSLLLRTTTALPVTNSSSLSWTVLKKCFTFHFLFLFPLSSIEGQVFMIVTLSSSFLMNTFSSLCTSPSLNLSLSSLFRSPSLSLSSLSSHARQTLFSSRNKSRIFFWKKLTQKCFVAGVAKKQKICPVWRDSSLYWYQDDLKSVWQ